MEPLPRSLKVLTSLHSTTKTDKPHPSCWHSTATLQSTALLCSTHLAVAGTASLKNKIKTKTKTPQRNTKEKATYVAGTTGLLGSLDLVVRT